MQNSSTVKLGLEIENSILRNELRSINRPNS